MNRNLLLTVILLGLPFVHLDSEAYLLNFIGRWHPLVIHFPIVAVLLTAIFEWIQGHSQSHHIQRIMNSLYSISLYSSLLAVFAGFFLYQTGDYEGSYIQNHQWGAIVLTILVAWSVYFRRAFQESKKWRWRQVYRSSIFLAFFIVFYTSHIGGSITHGPDFLTEPLQKMNLRNQLQKTAALKRPASLQVFGDIIQPILKTKCMKCHNDAKNKGGFNMSSYAQIKKGGKSEKPGIVTGSVEESELLSRVSLPQDHEDFMPPDGKIPLDEDEFNLLKWWVISGATDVDTLGAGPTDSASQKSLRNYLPKLAESQLSTSMARADRIKLSPKLIRLGVDLGLKIQSDPTSDSTYYAVSMQLPPKAVGDEQISKLLRYKDLFSKISLVSADLSEEGLYYLSQMPNLREIILIKCCIKGEGLVHLAELPKLELLNLSHTDINDVNLMNITSFPNLKKVYLFNTPVDPKIIQVLDKHLSSTKVSLEEGPYY